MNINYELLQFFVYNKIIKKDEADEILVAYEKINETADEYLVVKEYCTQVTALEALAEFYCMPCVEMDMLDIDRSLVEKFSYEFLKKNKVVPVVIDEKTGVLLVATSKPVDCNALSSLALVFPCRLDFVLVPSVQVDRYIDSIVAVISTSAALNDLNQEKDGRLAADSKSQVQQVISFKEEDVINNPAVRLVDSVIKEAIPYRASDIHIEPFEKVVRVRYRIDGTLQQRAEFPIESYPAICARLKIMAGMNIAERRQPQDGRINLIVGGKEFDFRVSSLPTVYGEKFVIRILDKTSFHFTRADLGFAESSNAIIDKILARPHGIVLLTGPTGSGKSTTLYAFLKEINTPSVNIVTVEDPVEYTLNGVNQTQINNKANMTFAGALRSILRQDPDIIMIGEIRDGETAGIAVQASITGHLVVSTLHTNSASGTVGRLVDMGIEPYLLADSIVGIIAQRLVRRLCPNCRRKVLADEDQKELLQVDASEELYIYEPCGCSQCDMTGFKGRIGVYEILEVTPKIKHVIAKNKSAEEIKEVALSEGMHTLRMSATRYVLDGITSISEMTKVSFDT